MNSVASSSSLPLFALVFSRKTFINAISGSAASMAALALFYPLDRVRGLAQMHDTNIDSNSKSSNFVSMLRELAKSEGWLGLYRGVQHMLIVLGASNFVYFYFMAMLKAMYISEVSKIRRRNGKNGITADDINSAVNLLLTTLSGVLNVLLTTPLWVVATRIASKRKQQQVAHENSESFEDDEAANTLIGGLIDIAQKEGVRGLWSGTTASLMLVSNPAIQFSAYNRFKRFLYSIRGTRELTSFEYLIIGAFSKMVATVLTYPLQLSQTRMRNTPKLRKFSSTNGISNVVNGANGHGYPNGNGTKNNEGCSQVNSFGNGHSESSPSALSPRSRSPEMVAPRPTTTLSCLKEIYRVEGYKGWFKGMDAKLIQTCLTAAFMFAFYEKLYKIILRSFPAQTK